MDNNDAAVYDGDIGGGINNNAQSVSDAALLYGNALGNLVEDTNPRVDNFALASEAVAGWRKAYEESAPIVARFSENFSEAFRVIGETLIPAIESGLSVIRMVDPLLFIAIDDQERAFRAYAGRYNMWHPRRKLSWRKLNRQQRRDAALDCFVAKADS